MPFVICCLCTYRMGLPVDSPDKNDDAHKYEEQGEESEGQPEACTHSLLPISNKRKKSKRYFTAGSPPFMSL